MQSWIEGLGSRASWRSTIIAGTEGFEFSIGDGRRWSIELQPMLNLHHNVAIKCQPDFMLRCDDPDVKPTAIFTDGFDPHVKPGEKESRLADDIKKRRAILESEQFNVWNIAWNDLDTAHEKASLAFLQPHLVSKVLQPYAQKLAVEGQKTPNVQMMCSNPFEQLKAFLVCPVAKGWKALAHHIGGFSLLMLAGRGIGQDALEVNSMLETWQRGYPVAPLSGENTGDWVWLTRLALLEDLLAYAYAQELVTNDFTNLKIALRLGDSYEERKGKESYLVRWRQFLAMMNLFQFADAFLPFTSSEAEDGTAPEIAVRVESAISAEWLEIIENTVPSLVKVVKLMASANKQVPIIEFYNDDLGDDLCAELAWPNITSPVALLVGDQSSFASKWQQIGWKIITEQEIMSKGDSWLLGQLPGKEG